MMMPNIIAIGWSHSREYPARTPRNKLDASDPPPSVIALWSHPGPESLV